MLALLASMGSARQGVAPRTVKPQPRGRPSGRPFPSRFTDIAAQAGLIHPAVYGGVDLRNDVTGDGHWLRVLLQGVTSNRSAIGARVTARYGTRTQSQDVTAQSSFYSANDRRLHFGLGPATSADLVVRWPNGASEKIASVEAGQLVIIREVSASSTAEVRWSVRIASGTALTCSSVGATLRLSLRC